MAKTVDIKNYIRGDSRVINVLFKEKVSGRLVPKADMSGCEAFLTINASQTPPDDGTDVTAAIKLSTTNFDPATPGTASFTLTNALTKDLLPQTYYYDVQLRDSGGNITSLPKGKFTVVDDITTRIT